MHSEAYDAFAYAYDAALGRRFFTAARQLLGELLERYPTAKRSHLDLACGTGLALEFFRSLGWRATGVDASVPMLQIARGRVPDARLIAGDLRALPLRGRFARITCLYDSLNHLLEREQLVAAFRGARGVMDHDSLFFFDMNHPDIYPEVWGLAAPYTSRGTDHQLEIATTYRKREKLATAMVRGWATIGGTRVNIREQRLQRAYSEKQIVTALEEAGLAPVDVIDFDPYQEADDVDAATVKLFFVCAPVSAGRARPS
jgi:SAM-dependent methyltransferase